MFKHKRPRSLAVAAAAGAMALLAWLAAVPATTNSAVALGGGDRAITVKDSVTMLAPSPGQCVASFAQPAVITIPATGTSGISSPYPSNLTVSGLTAPITKVTVKLNSFSHTFPDDVDILLVGPGGQNAIIMSDVGTALDAVNVTLTLDDTAATALPDAAQLVTGTFRPTNIGAGDTFPAPAPAPLGGSALSVFNGTNPNGTWSLYVVDDLGGDAGSFGSGYELDITTDCMNLIFVIEELTPGGPIPYVPGTWVKNPVRATWTCTTTGPSGLIHWTPAGNGPFFTASFVKTWTQNGSHTEQPRGLSLSDDCRDRAGNVGVVDPSVPTVAFKVNIDNVAPVCNLSPLVKTVAVGGPTTITWSFNPSDAVSGVATTELVSATDVGGATHADWTLGGPIADKTGTVTFSAAPQSVVFVYLVTDIAGNTKTCTAAAKTP